MTTHTGWQSNTHKATSETQKLQGFYHRRDLPLVSFLSRQNTSFVVTKVCLSWQIFVATKVLSRQAYFCRDKHVFVTTKNVFCCDKKHVLSWQKACFVVTNTYLSQQKWYLWQLLSMTDFHCLVAETGHPQAQRVQIFRAITAYADLFIQHGKKVKCSGKNADR